MRSTSVKTLFQIIVAAIFVVSARLIAQTEVGGSKNKVPNGEECSTWAEAQCDTQCLSLGGCAYNTAAWDSTGHCAWGGMCVT